MNIAARRATGRHAAPRRVTARRVTARRAMARRVTGRRVTARHAAARRAMAHRATAPVRVAVPAATALAVIAVTGCSAQSSGTPSVHASKAVALMTSPPASSPAATTPAATAPSAASMPPARSTAPATPAPASPAGPPQGALTAKVTIPGAGSGLVPGGPAVRFRVIVTNRSAQTYSNVLPLVSLGHCTCTAKTLFPAGTLQERESTSNVWQTIPYDVEGFGTDYLKVSEPGGIQMISPGGVASFEYRVALKPATSAQVTAGQAALDVTLIALPGHTPIGAAPSASAPIAVQSGQPPA
jgi:hypothetical protein